MLRILTDDQRRTKSIRIPSQRNMLEGRTNFRERRTNIRKRFDKAIVANKKVELSRLGRNAYEKRR